MAVAVSFAKRARAAFLQWLATPPGSWENKRWRRKVRKYLGRHAPGTVLKTALGRNTVRSVLTALITTRSLVHPKALNVQPIVAPSTEGGYRGWVKDVRGFWSELGFGRPSGTKDLQRSV